MSKIYDLIRKKSEDPEGKARWEKLGVMIDKDGKLSVKLDLLPVGEWDGWLVVSERRERETEESDSPKGKPPTKGYRR